MNVMSCITIETDAMLANFFGSPEYEKIGESKVNIQIVEKCAIFLANNLPGYVFFDLSKNSINDVARNSPWYQLDGDDIIYSGVKIDRDNFNYIYTSRIANRITNTVDDFFVNELYQSNRKIEYLKPVMVG